MVYISVGLCLYIIQVVSAVNSASMRNFVASGQNAVRTCIISTCFSRRAITASQLTLNRPTHDREISFFISAYFCSSSSFQFGFVV